MGLTAPPMQRIPRFESHAFLKCQFRTEIEVLYFRQRLMKMPWKVFVESPAGGFLFIRGIAGGFVPLELKMSCWRDVYDARTLLRPAAGPGGGRGLDARNELLRGV